MSTRRLLRAVFAVASVAIAPLAAVSVRAQTVPTGFSIDLAIWGGFTGEPSGFAFLPDRRVVLLERETGAVRLAAAGAQTTSLIATIPNVAITDERGLLGVAVDPAWPTRPYLYFSFTRSDGLSVLVMYTASGDLSNPASTNVTLSSPYEILETPDVQTYHNGGTVRFGLDGKLYATWGDDGSPCHAQDLTWLNGKMVRLDVSSLPGTGSGPPPKGLITPADNPFVGNPDLNARLVFVWGMRNPFRFTIDPLTGDRYIGEVGENLWEEIDRIPAGTGGQNLGWPLREGPAAGTLGLTCGQGNTFTDPVYSYPHDGINPNAVIGGPIYRGVPSSPMTFPLAYEGSYFFLDWGAGWIRRIVQVAGVWQLAPAVPGQPAPDRWGDAFLYYSDFQEGPDGALYLMRHGGNWGLYRIRHAAPTSVEAPLASVTALDVQARPNPGKAGRDVEFSWVAPRAGRVTLRIFDAVGRRVAQLDDPRGASRGVLAWSGRDGAGTAVPAGVYFYRLTGPGGTAGGRVTLLR